MSHLVRTKTFCHPTCCTSLVNVLVFRLIIYYLGKYVDQTLTALCLYNTRVTITGYLFPRIKILESCQLSERNLRGVELAACVLTFSMGSFRSHWISPKRINEIIHQCCFDVIRLKSNQSSKAKAQFITVGKARLDEVPGIRVCSGGDKLLDGFEVPRLQKRRRPGAAKTFPFPSLPFSYNLTL